MTDRDAIVRELADSLREMVRLAKASDGSNISRGASIVHMLEISDAVERAEAALTRAEKLE